MDEMYLCINLASLIINYNIRIRIKIIVRLKNRNLTLELPK